MPAANKLSEMVDRLRSYKPQSYDWQPKIEEPKIVDRVVKVCPPPIWTPNSGEVKDAREIIRNSIAEYLAEPWPNHILLVRAMPGTGKTTAAVAIAESLAAQGKRVAYAGPRHDFYHDLMDKAQMIPEWYEWLPRQPGDEERPKEKPQTCLYTEQINSWMYRGYDGIEFCSGVCGWDYINKKCVYHFQKNTARHLIYIQHQHIALGHPLAATFDVLIGDESPVGAFCHRWQIPGKWIMPSGLPPEYPLTEILYTMSNAAAQLNKKAVLAGPDLLDTLGGAGAVLAACDEYDVPLDAIPYAAIHQAEEASETPFFHLPALVNLLKRESTQALDGKPYPHRVLITAGLLTLLLRHTPTTLPQHTIWMDATGRPEVYRRIFQRPVEVVDAHSRMHGKIFQVVDRANGKQAITGRDGATRTEHAAHAEQIVREIIQQHGYQRPSIIGFKNFIDRLDADGITVGHFYAARGTNYHENADAIFIVGAPQASPYQIVETAKMIYFEDDAAFDTTWTTKDVQYIYEDEHGDGRSYPTSGFWRDRRLQAILETIREDEIVQAAHRGRPVNHPVDIWLLTNVPVDGLPPDQLITMREILVGDELGVNIWKWKKLVDKAEADGGISLQDAEQLGIHYATARRYLQRLAKRDDWQLITTKNGAGRPKLSVKRKLDI